MPTPTKPDVAEAILNLLDVLSRMGFPQIEQAWDCAYLENALYVLYRERLKPGQHTELLAMNLEVRHHLPYAEGRHRYLIEFVPTPDDES